MADAFELANNDIFQYGNGDRPEATNIAILITDGKPTEREADTVPEANDLKDRGVVIIAIGVTQNVDIDQLKEIATREDEVYEVNDFADLDALLNIFAGDSCNEVG